jgi:CrcB protein
MNSVFLVGLGGVLGANARYLISIWAAGRFGTAFPYGTFIVNVSGSLLIGIALGLLVDHDATASSARLLLVTGFLGAYTTFSTFTFETLALVRQGAIRAALSNALGSTVLGVGGAAAGFFLTRPVA